MLTQLAKLFAFVVIAGSLMAGTGISAAESSDGAANAPDPAEANPVAQVRLEKSWEYGPFVNYGNGVGGADRSSYRFLWAGFQLS